jgi:hypothetical protein
LGAPAGPIERISEQRDEEARASGFLVGAPGVAFRLNPLVPLREGQLRGTGGARLGLGPSRPRVDQTDRRGEGTGHDGHEHGTRHEHLHPVATDELPRAIPAPGGRGEHRLGTEPPGDVVPQRGGRVVPPLALF